MPQGLACLVVTKVIRLFLGYCTLEWSWKLICQSQVRSPDNHLLCWFQVAYSSWANLHMAPPAHFLMMLWSWQQQKGLRVQSWLQTNKPFGYVRPLKQCTDANPGHNPHSFFFELPLPTIRSYTSSWLEMGPFPVCAQSLKSPPQQGSLSISLLFLHQTWLPHLKFVSALRNLHFCWFYCVFLIVLDILNMFMQ